MTATVGTSFLTDALQGQSCVSGSHCWDTLLGWHRELGAQRSNGQTRIQEAPLGKQSGAATSKQAWRSHLGDTIICTCSCSPTCWHATVTCQAGTQHCVL